MSTATTHIETEKSSAEQSRSKLVPTLRFKEFEGNWSKEPIGNHFDLMSGFAFKSEDISEDFSGVPILRGINITEGFIRHNEKIDRYFLGDTSKLDRLRVEVGDLVLGMDGSKVGKNSALVTERDADSLLIQRVARLREKKDACLSFIYSHINSIRFHKYVDVVNTSSGIPHISSKQINDFKIYFPKSLPEQQKIASFLSAVDEKIQQLTKKKALLEQYKKGVMQQLFSGQLRFKDETGNPYPDWEEKLLGEICDYKNGGSFENLVVDDGEFNLITLNSIDINGKLKSNHKKVTKTDNSLLEGDLIMVLSDVAHGNFLGLSDIIPDNNYVLNQRMGALKPKIKLNRIYLKTFINYSQKYFKLMGQGSSQQNLSKGDILNFKVLFPIIEEQQKIATYLSSIDTKIESVNNQITQTQTFKKGLLQQMFV